MRSLNREARGPNSRGNHSAQCLTPSSVIEKYLWLMSQRGEFGSGRRHIEIAERISSIHFS